MTQKFDFIERDFQLNNLWILTQKLNVNPIPDDETAVNEFNDGCIRAFTDNHAWSTMTEEAKAELIAHSAYLDLYQPSMDPEVKDKAAENKACLFTTSELVDLCNHMKKKNVLAGATQRRYSSLALSNAHKQIHQLIAMDAYMRTVSHLA
jgi:predicted Fe-S protein YdhL (DUF1289 family)